MENKKNSMGLAIVMVITFAVVIGVAGYFAYNNYFSSTVQSQNNSQEQNTQTVPDPTANWNTVKNDELGFAFKYPADFGTKYASFQNNPTTIVTKETSKIDDNGCLKTGAYSPKESRVTINNMQFCLAGNSDSGAGQLYNSYNYTILKNGDYITLQYVVHTLNGCSPYIGTSDYQPCADFMNNYDTNVTKIIEVSVGTLQFTK